MQLTDEALATCKFIGVESKELIPRPLEAFLKKKVSQQEATK